MLGGLALIYACTPNPEPPQPESPPEFAPAPASEAASAPEAPEPPRTECAPILDAIAAGEVDRARQLYADAHEKFGLGPGELEAELARADEDRRRLLGECLYARGVLARDVGLRAPRPDLPPRDPVRARYAFERSRAFVDDPRVREALAGFEPQAKLEPTASATAAAVAEDICAGRILTRGRDELWKTFSDYGNEEACAYALTAPAGAAPPGLDAQLVEYRPDGSHLLLFAVVQDAEQARAVVATRVYDGGLPGTGESAALAIDALRWRDIDAAAPPELFGLVSGIRDKVDAECELRSGEVDQRLLLCAGLECAVLPLVWYLHEDSELEDGETCPARAPVHCDGGALVPSFVGGDLRLKAKRPKRCKTMEAYDYRELPEPGPLPLERLWSEYPAEELWRSTEAP